MGTGFLRGVVGAAITALAASALAQSGGVPSACSGTPPGIVIFQPWNNDAEVGTERWSARLRDLRLAGAHTLLLQWTSYGPTEFLHAKAGPDRTWLALLIDEAIAKGWRILFGLSADPQFFEILNRDDESVRLMLQRRRLFSLAAARALGERYAGSPAFAGWYLPEEIDDVNWRTPARSDLLADHLQSLGEALRTITPDAPIYVSAFFSDPATPAEFATQLLNLSDLFGGRWLVQDGLGTRRMSVAQTAQYLRDFAQRDDKPRKLLGLVEAFDETPDAAGRNAYCRIDAATLAARRALWCAETGTPAVAVFSLTHLVADAAGSARATYCPSPR